MDILYVNLIQRVSDVTYTRQADSMIGKYYSCIMQKHIEEANGLLGQKICSHYLNPQTGFTLHTITARLTSFSHWLLTGILIKATKLFLFNCMAAVQNYNQKGTLL